MHGTKSQSTKAGAALAAERVQIGFGGFVAVDGVDFAAEPGEFICLLGPSGCGKSTLITAVAGFEKINSGSLLIDGQPVLGPSSETGMVFQGTEALFDWLTIRQNVEYGSRMRGIDPSQRRRISDHHLELVGLTSAANKFPSQLSGGMRQRAQIARVLANEPRVVLMDEPFGALDAQTRHIMQNELDRIWQESGCTIVFVTHDIDEAILLADRILVMTAGPRARIKSTYEVDLPRPRDQTSSGAIELHRKLRSDIGDEVRKVLRNQGLDKGDV